MNQVTLTQNMDEVDYGSIMITCEDFLNYIEDTYIPKHKETSKLDYEYLCLLNRSGFQNHESLVDRLYERKLIIETLLIPPHLEDKKFEILIRIHNLLNQLKSLEQNVTLT